MDLDDNPNHRPKRIERDKEVERMLAGASIPPVRIEDRGSFESQDLAQLVQRGIEKHAAANA